MTPPLFRIFFVGLLFFIGYSSLFPPMLSAQPMYGNEWIDYERTYYKFEVNQVGMHRLSYETLVASGIPLTGADFQLFTGGVQVPIYVKTDGVFGSGDYIEFYGTRNDGKFDTQLYETPSYQLNDEVSLFTERRVYYLVANPLGEEHLRYATVENDLSGDLPPVEPFFYYESKVTQSFSFHSGEPYYTTPTLGILGDFSKGEGWCSSMAVAAAPFTIKVPTDYIYLDATDEEDVVVRTRLVGRNRSIGVINDKHIQIKINENTYIDDFFSRFDIANYRFDLRPSELNTDPDVNGDVFTRVKYHALNGTLGGFDYNTQYSVAYLKMTYPRLFNFDGRRRFDFSMKVDIEKYIEIEHFNVENEEVVLYDLTNKQRIVPLVEDSLVKVKLTPDVSIDNNRKFALTNNSTGFFEVADLAAYEFLNFDDLANQGDFLLIYHDSLSQVSPDPIKRYETYRTSEEGGNHQVVTVDIQDLYEQFAWGIDQHPLAIQNFMKYGMDTWETPPAYLLLLGKSIMYSEVRNKPNNRAASFVPSYGHIPADNLLGARGSHDYRPVLAVGRISAQTGNQVHAYLDKLIAYETLNREVDCTFEERNWMKSILHVAKGWGAGQTEDFRENLDSYEPILEGPQAGMYVSTVLEDTYGPPGGNDTSSFYPAPGFAEAMNQGVALINYFGHGIGNYWQYDIDTLPQTYNNTGKYPFILSNACSVGQIHQKVGFETMVEDYVLAEESGAIAFLASTNLSSAYMVDVFSERLLYNLMDTLYDASIAQSIRKTIYDLYAPEDDNVRKVCTEFTFMGDPAVKMYNWENPEYILVEESFAINQDSLLYEEDNFEVNFVVQNMGRALRDSFEVNLMQTTPDGATYEAWSALIPSTLYQDSFSLQIPLVDSLRILGDNTFTLHIDPNNILTEDCEDNNGSESRSIFLFDCNPNCPIDTMDIDTMDMDTTIMSALQYTQWELEQIQIFPNPNEGIFTIEAGKAIIREINIYDASGKVVYHQKNINDTALLIDLRDQPSGNYLVRIETNKSVIARTVVF